MRTTPPETWALVADRSQLRLFREVERPVEKRFELEAAFRHPDGRKHGRDLVSDRPGRSFESFDKGTHGQGGATRHSYGDPSSPEDRVIDEVVRQAGEMIGEKGLDRKNAVVTVYAEPRLMGVLRPVVVRALPRAEVVFREKDYAWIQDGELAQRLHDEAVARA